MPRKKQFSGEEAAQHIIDWVNSDCEISDDNVDGEDFSDDIHGDQTDFVYDDEDLDDVSFRKGK